MEVIFRTSDGGRHPGFTASVVCFDPETRDMPGCTRPQEDDSESPTDASLTDAPPTTGTGRKRRDLELFVS